LAETFGVIRQTAIAQVVGTTQARVAQIINNANFGEIYNLLSQGRDMDYIAEHYHLDLASCPGLGRKMRRIQSPCLTTTGYY